MIKKNNHPIGIFDSGLGGLTVVREIKKILPNEDIVYFGDNARLPYGIKSKRQIIECSLNNARFLLKKKIKALVIACNSSSANALYVLKKRLTIPIIDVIRPASQAACEVTRNKKIGIIGTSATIESHAYQREIRKIDSRIKVYTQKCPLLVPLVEEGWIHNEITDSIIKKYLWPLLKERIDTLLLGCTHYPLLKRAIIKQAGKHVNIVDSGPRAAYDLMRKLTSCDLLNATKRKGTLKIFVSDLSPHFITIGERFLKHKLEHVSVVRI
ncbi:MAG: glutamate racemase [Candidatus Omnitrophica bacterium]|nr:glutamate racemase [Candidatus Omnitrophota bacterium]